MVENITENEVYITAVFTKKPKFGGHFRVGNSNPTIGWLRDTMVLEPRKSVNLLFKIIATPKKFIQKDLYIFDIYIIDQFGNKHLLKDIEFFYDQQRKFKDLFKSYRDLANLD